LRYKTTQFIREPLFVGQIANLSYKFLKVIIIAKSRQVKIWFLKKDLIDFYTAFQMKMTHLEQTRMSVLP